MKAQCLVILGVICLGTGVSSCTATFTGKVIDADTKAPIEGAVVVAKWNETRATPTGPSGRAKDVQETLTDENGAWTIKGPRGRRGGDISALFTFLTGTYCTDKPDFVVFKPGYCSWPNGLAVGACKGKIKREGDAEREGETLELPRLANDEDRLEAYKKRPTYQDGDDLQESERFLKKQIQFLRLLNEERISVGLGELETYRELQKELDDEE